MFYSKFISFIINFWLDRKMYKNKTIFVLMISYMIGLSDAYKKSYSQSTSNVRQSNGIVVKIIDGDTIKVKKDDNVVVNVRLM